MSVLSTPRLNLYLYFVVGPPPWFRCLGLEIVCSFCFNFCFQLLSACLPFLGHPSIRHGNEDTVSLLGYTIRSAFVQEINVDACIGYHSQFSMDAILSYSYTFALISILVAAAGGSAALYAGDGRVHSPGALCLHLAFTAGKSS